MMRQERYYKYHRDWDNFTSIIMVPYKGNTMMIVLPDEENMHEVEKNINKDYLKYWHDKLYERQEAAVAFPQMPCASSATQHALEASEGVAHVNFGSES
ncbi:hypothetical protein MHYP_G00061600 [Metynnis hypsauchen]